MNVIEEIKKAYELRTVSWKQKGKLLDTDCGLKRVVLWSDDNLLKWHVKWRDQTGRNSVAIADRMIRTATGHPWIEVNGKYVTLHDEVEGSYDRAGHEKAWGLLIGTMLKAGLEASQEFSTLCQEKTYSFGQCLSAVHQLGKQFTVLESVKQCLVEADKRLKQAEEVKKAAGECLLPIMDQPLSVLHGKQIFNILFYKGSHHEPIRGYLPLRHFLRDWLKECGPHSLKKLLHCINEHYSLQQEQGLLLLAELLMPWELVHCVEQLETKELAHIISTVEQFEQNWDFNRILLHCYSEWLDEKRRKVAL
ncbi:hypothetical protein A374_11435 [Fictibacillus macauensis ZFHKF-1]|uniref:Uncharacterized protein n=1 Tax=Fictibacillus macauensis ZFHKF-1 TaxID=1196324 RepID=I8UEV7_9BACL|nr:hypothetical protein [Fictibacillus macauensis]EIT85353.1 hypothetical protein A374_11435 [Fictibacillus macauensis ZFHKF-1]